MSNFLISEELESQQLLPSQCIIDGEPTENLIIFAHGAGANMQHVFMQTLAEGLAGEDIGVARFNFSYMRANAIDGKRRPPDRAPKLINDFNIHIDALVSHFSPKRVWLLGKSMGGRMATIVAAKRAVEGVICLGYPFVPLKGGEPRLAPIVECKAPVTILQGERDKFGNREQILSWPELSDVKLHWLPDGDHGFKPRKKSGHELEANLQLAISLCKSHILRD